MANRGHIARLTKTVSGLNDYKGWNRWRAANRRLVPDLSEADLDEIDLVGDTNLNGANLVLASLFEASIEQIRLRGANLEGADLRYAQFSEADLRGANLDHTDLTGASLNGADMRGVSLWGARLEKTKLFRTRLDDARAGYTIFANCDLTAAEGLRTMRHDGPSTIGIDTIFRSEGRIPSEFLVGAGVPNILLDYLSSLASPGAIQFYSCFISYSTKDQE